LLQIKRQSEGQKAFAKTLFVPQKPTRVAADKAHCFLKVENLILCSPKAVIPAKNCDLLGLLLRAIH
jgi:hypothetical protein